MCLIVKDGRRRLVSCIRSRERSVAVVVAAALLALSAKQWFLVAVAAKSAAVVTNAAAGEWGGLLWPWAKSSLLAASMTLAAEVANAAGAIYSFSVVVVVVAAAPR